MTTTRSRPLSARELILTLMDSSTSESLGARFFVAAGELFQMDPGGIRVALARLVQDGSLSAYQRGRYRLASRAGTLHQLVRSWSKIEASLGAWHGGWLTIFVGHLARADKTRVRSNERALHLYGFAPAQTGLWIRPDNLLLPLADLREALLHLGLSEASWLARVSEFEPAGFPDAAEMWNIMALEKLYQANIDALAASGESLARQDANAAARETLLLGRQITRDILLDPLLPDQLIDGDLRRRMISAMHDYDRIGKAFWRSFFERHDNAPPIKEC